MWDQCFSRLEEGGVTVECPVPGGAAAPRPAPHLARRPETEIKRAVATAQVRFSSNLIIDHLRSQLLNNYLIFMYNDV